MEAWPQLSVWDNVEAPQAAPDGETERKKFGDSFFDIGSGYLIYFFQLMK